MNPFYMEAAKCNVQYLNCNGHVRRLTVWKEHFTFYQSGSSDPYEIYVECDFPE